MIGDTPGGEKKRLPMLLGIGITAVTLIFVAVLLVSGSKPPVYSVGNGTFTISSDYGQKIKFSDIKSVQLKNTLPAGLSKVNGFNLGSILKGKFSSKAGDATLYVDTAKPPFLYLTTRSGLIILNDQTTSKTQALYRRLQGQTGQ